MLFFCTFLTSQKKNEDERLIHLLSANPQNTAVAAGIAHLQTTVIFTTSAPTPSAARNRIGSAAAESPAVGDSAGA